MSRYSVCCPIGYLHFMSPVFKKRGEHYTVPKNLRGLPGKYYSDPDIYQVELTQIFYRQWLYACRAEEIPNPGDYRLFEIGEESVIIVRGKDQAIRAHFNVCRHRGTRLCMEATGHFSSGTIQCPYHAWTYDTAGALVSAPLAHGMELHYDDLHLHHAAIYNWEGFIFINLSAEPVSFEQQMSALIGRFANWNMSELHTAKTIRYELQCNWKLIFQNYQECYHCPGVHPFLVELTPFNSARHDCMDGPVIGGYMDLSQGTDSMTMTGRAAGPPICNPESEHLHRVYYYTIFPTLLLTPHPDFVLFHQIIPDGPGKVINICHWLFHPDVIANPGHQPGIASAIEFWDMTNKQDWQVCEQMQLGVRSTRFDKGHYTEMEDILHAIDVEYLKLMEH